jgi:hypothetical protein
VRELQKSRFETKGGPEGNKSAEGKKIVKRWNILGIWRLGED